MKVRLSFTCILLILINVLASAQNNAPGNIMVLRVGTGLEQLTSAGSPVFLDEYKPTGEYVGQTALPTAVNGSNNILILNGTNNTEGMITRSSDGRYVIVAGYNRVLGEIGALNSTSSAVVNRTIGRVDAAYNVNTSTILNDYSDGGSPRCATSSDGTKFWAVGGTGGLRYCTLGATTSTQLNSTITSIRNVLINNNSLFISNTTSGTSRVAQVGTGLPQTTGQAINNLPGLPTTGSPYQFVFFDLDGTVAGPDVLYIADDAAGILKYSLVGGNWVANGSAGTGTDLYRGLTGYKDAAGNTIYLFATRLGGNGSSGGGELVRITDNSSYNGTLSASPSLLATASVNQAFRGVALAPLSWSVPLGLISFTASKTPAGNMIAWTTNNEINTQEFEVESSSDGRHFTKFAAVNAKGSLLYNSYDAIDKQAGNGTTYYRLRMLDKDGAARYSKTVWVMRALSAKFAVWPNPVVNGTLAVQHPQAGKQASIAVYTADGRLMLRYQVPQNAVQTSLNVSELNRGNYVLVFQQGNEKLSQAIMKQ